MKIAHSGIVLVSAAALAVAGCYTQLMTPQEFIQVRRSVQSGSGTSAGANNAFTVNYNQSCVSCHSLNELNERAEEMEYYGIRSVHNGYLLSSRDWDAGVPVPMPGAPSPGIPFPSPEPVLWPTNPTVRSSWWQPAGTTVPTSRPRTDGPTRDPGTTRDRSPVTAQPSPQPSTPPPTVTAPTTTTSSKPASTPPAETTRSRESSSNSTPAPAPSRPRTDGASRDDSANRPR
ncbi:MAG: hypothetical protein HUU02_06385 [Bacteroidetes bacterium]|nr:hypothetical protein [Bacteroidota bacterium]